MWPPLPGCFWRKWHISWISKEMKEFIREGERRRDKAPQISFLSRPLSLFAVRRLEALVIGFLLLLLQEPHSKWSHLIWAEQTALSRERKVVPCPHRSISCGSLDNEEMGYLWEWVSDRRGILEERILHLVFENHILVGEMGFRWVAWQRQRLGAGVSQELIRIQVWWQWEKLRGDIAWGRSVSGVPEEGTHSPATLPL